MASLSDVAKGFRLNDAKPAVRGLLGTRLGAKPAKPGTRVRFRTRKKMNWFDTKEKRQAAKVWGRQHTDAFDPSLVRPATNPYHKIARIEARVKGKTIGSIDVARTPADLPAKLKPGQRVAPGKDGYVPGHIRGILVKPEYRRQGVATHLWDEARRQGFNPKHSPVLSEDGKKWAAVTKGLPSIMRAKLPGRLRPYGKAPGRATPGFNLPIGEGYPKLPAKPGSKRLRSGQSYVQERIRAWEAGQTAAWQQATPSFKPYEARYSRELGQRARARSRKAVDRLSLPGVSKGFQPEAGAGVSDRVRKAQAQIHQRRVHPLENRFDRQRRLSRAAAEGGLSVSSGDYEYLPVAVGSAGLRRKNDTVRRAYVARKNPRWFDRVEYASTDDPRAQLHAHKRSGWDLAGRRALQAGQIGALGAGAGLLLGSRKAIKDPRRLFEAARSGNVRGLLGSKRSMQVTGGLAGVGAAAGGLWSPSPVSIKYRRPVEKAFNPRDPRVQLAAMGVMGALGAAGWYQAGAAGADLHGTSRDYLRSADEETRRKIVGARGDGRYRHVGNNVYARQRRLFPGLSREYVNETARRNKGRSGRVYVRTRLWSPSHHGATWANDSLKDAYVEAFPKLWNRPSARLRSRFIAQHEMQHVKDSAGTGLTARQVQDAKRRALSAFPRGGKSRFRDIMSGQAARRSVRFGERMDYHRGVDEGRADVAAERLSRFPAWKASGYSSMAVQPGPFTDGYLSAGGSAKPSLLDDRRLSGVARWKRELGRERGRG